MKRVDFYRVFVISGLASLVIVYALLWTRMVISHAERTGSDFVSAYTGGVVARTWGGANVYNLSYQQAVQDEVVGFDLAPGQVLMFNHPPYLVPLLSLLMDGNYTASLVRYALVMAALYAAALAAAWQLLRREDWRRGGVVLMLAGMATFYPLFVSLVNTQDTALMVLGGFLWLFGLLTGRDWLAGLGLALTTVRPHVTMVLALPFLLRRRNVFWWFCAGAAVLGLVSLLAVGVDGLKAYLDILLKSAGGNFYGMQEAAMVNLVGLLTRHASGLGMEAIHWIGWGGYAAAILALCLVWGRSWELDGRHFGLAVILAVFFAPHLHYHDLTLLLVPLLALLLMAVRGRFLRLREAALLPLGLSIILLVSNFAPGPKADLPVFVMILMGLYLWYPAPLFFLHVKKGKT
jgi:Glycosyltransferase family 87